MVFQTLKWSRYPGDPGSAQERSGGLRNQSSKRKVKKKKKSPYGAALLSMGHKKTCKICICKNTK